MWIIPHIQEFLDISEFFLFENFILSSDDEITNVINSKQENTKTVRQ